MNKRVVIILVLTALLVGGIVSLAHAHERNDGGYFTIVDEQNNPVYYTGRKVQVGDECLTEKNVRYQIVRIEGDIAYAKNIGTVDLKKYSANEPYYRMPLVSRIFGYRLAEAQGTKVAIYHTHTDESYVPTDGTESIKGNGGIFKVGSAFAQGLQKNGIEAVFSEAKHDPHDDMAYERSRRTALDLIKKNQPAAIFDIHRDAVPPKVYSGTINGQQISKVQLVVGKYGPTAKQIEDFALKIKSASDSKYPGLVKGIFFAKGGDYNQDLHPRSMLLEVGAHTNDRTSAEKGVALFADVIPSVIGGGGKPNKPGHPVQQNLSVG